MLRTANDAAHKHTALVERQRDESDQLLNYWLDQYKDQVVQASRFQGERDTAHALLVRCVDVLSYTADLEAVRGGADLGFAQSLRQLLVDIEKLRADEMKNGRKQ